MNPRLLFLKRKGGLGEKENFFSQEKKLSLSPEKHTLIFRTERLGGNVPLQHNEPLGAARKQVRNIRKRSIPSVIRTP